MVSPNAGPAPWRPESLSSKVAATRTLVCVGIAGWVVIGVAVLAIAAVTLYLFGQWRMYGPPPPDLRRSGDGTRDDY